MIITIFYHSVLHEFAPCSHSTFHSSKFNSKLNKDLFNVTNSSTHRVNPYSYTTKIKLVCAYVQYVGVFLLI